MTEAEETAREFDKDSPVPIYYQLKRLLEAKIRRGELKPGDRIPTEQELCERYHVSRSPVRQALTELARERLIERYTRRGSFVRDGTHATRGKLELRAIIVDKRWEYPLRTAAGTLGAETKQRVELSLQEVPLPQLRQHLVSAVARGEAPDLALVDSVWVAEFVRGDYLQPLQELDAEWIEGEYQTAFYPTFVEAGLYDGGIYAVPSEVDLVLLWYRRDVFQAEGLKPPPTWEELVRVCRRLARPEVRERHGLGRHPLLLPGGPTAGEATTYHLLPFIWAAGGGLLANGLVVLDSPGTVRALQFLRDLIHTHQVVPPEVVESGWEDPLARFARGEAALAVVGSYAGALMRAEAHWGPETFRQRAGFTLIPAGPGGQRVTAAGGMAYAVFRQSRAPREALQLIKRAVAPQTMATFCRATGHNPPRVDVAEGLSLEGDWFLRETAALLPGARIRPRHPEYAHISRMFRELVAEVLRGEGEIGPAVRRAAEAIAAVTGLPMARF